MRIIKYFADWCLPCTKLSEQIDRLKIDGKLDVTIETVDIGLFPDAAQDCGIRSIPVIIKLDEDGVEIARLVGSTTDEKLLRFLS